MFIVIIFIFYIAEHAVHNGIKEFEISYDQLVIAVGSINKYFIFLLLLHLLLYIVLLELLGFMKIVIF